MNRKKIIVVDDEPLIRKSLLEILRYEGYSVECAEHAQEALQLIEADPPTIVITDLKLPDINGVELLKRIKAIDTQIEVILITGYGSVDSAVEAMKAGAFDYITKPIIDAEIKAVVHRIFEQKQLVEENRFLKRRLSDVSRSRFHDLIGQNSSMQRIYGLIETIAPTNASVLIQGGSGTGKRLIALAIHKSDTFRKERPFVEVSCGALPESLLESELFGHVRGSFTHAIKDRQGRFEAADTGTIFLDEIDTFSPKLQVKLLRVLQEGAFERVGDTSTRRVDVRVIAATNQDLKELIAKNQFREDLYYRLDVIPISVPLLRERKDDIPLLVEYFLNNVSQKTRKQIVDITDDALGALQAYDWPGNVRELENAIERAVILCRGNVIERQHLSDKFQKLAVTSGVAGETKKTSASIKDTLRLSEKEIIKQALKESGGKRKKAAQALGINRTTLYNKMKQYGLLTRKRSRKT